MTLLKGKHVVKEVSGQRCTIVEEGANQERIDFLRDILEFNGYEVRVEEEAMAVEAPPPSPAPDEGGEGIQAGNEGEKQAEPEEYSVPEIPVEKKFTIGVTSMIFNPVIAVYQRMLKTRDGRRITADYWNQKTDVIEPNYWDRHKKN